MALPSSASTGALVNIRPQSGGQAKAFRLPSQKPTSPTMKPVAGAYERSQVAEVMRITTPDERPMTTSSVPEPSLFHPRRGALGALPAHASFGMVPGAMYSPYEHNSYDENQRLRRELNAQKKRCRQLEVELSKPPKSRVQTLKGAYFPEPLPADPPDDTPNKPDGSWQFERQRMQEDHDAKVVELMRERDEALDQVKQVRHTLQTQMASRAKTDKEQRVELLRRQSLKRILNARLTRGWGAWKEFSQKRSYALRRLYQVAAHLRSPELARAFAFWNWLLAERARLRHLRELAEQEKTLEGKLRSAQFEAGQLAMLKVANEDEIAELRVQLSAATEQTARKEQALQDAEESMQGSEALRRESEQALAKVAAAEAAREEMAAELASHRAKHEALLQRLLVEQRQRLEEEVGRLRRQLAMREEHEGSALQALKEQVSAEEAAKAKEERIELLRRQAMRRVLNADLSNGFSAWYELWAAKTYAMSTMRRVAAKLKAPELSNAFGFWAEWWRAVRTAQLKEQYSSGNEALQALQAELETARAELAEVELDRHALRERITQLDGGVAEAARLREQAEADAREERIETCRRQSMRRMLNRDLAAGWAAWQELCAARSYALDALRAVGQRLRSPLLADTFGYWSATAAKDKEESAYLAMAQQAAGLDDEKASLSQQLARVTREYEQRLREAEEAQRVALERQLIALTGSADEQAAMLEAKAKEERIEMLRRQSGRRLLHGALGGAWTTWSGYASERAFIMGRLRECANRLHAPEKTRLFAYWKGDWLGAARAAEVASLAMRAAGLEGERTSLAEELRLARGEYERLKEAAADEKRIALERLTVELTGSAEQVQAMEQAKAREERIELCRRQSLRRMLNRDLAVGWAAWHELYAARSSAINRLRQSAERLRAPELSDAYRGWVRVVEEEHHAARVAKLKEFTTSLDAQLRQSKFEVTNLKMVQTAQLDEIGELKAKLRDALGDRAIVIEQRETVRSERTDYPDVKAKAESLAAHLAEAERRAAEAEEEAERQRAKHEALLSQLLAEQRERFEKELAAFGATSDGAAHDAAVAYEALAASLEAKANEHREATVALAREQEASAKQRQAFERERRELALQAKTTAAELDAKHKAEALKLKRELKELKEREERRKYRRTTTPAARVYIDEGPNALPISAQIAQHLRSNASRVVDLFREWDSNGDGRVSRAEFRKAIPRIGLDVSETFVDELFDKWDETGDGELNLNELVKILRNKGANPATPKLQAAGAAVRAAAAFGSAYKPKTDLAALARQATY